MRLIAGLVIAVALTFIFRVPLKKTPVVFYTLAVVLCISYIIVDTLAVPPWFREYFLFLFQSNTLAMGFFTIVMFTGVLEKGSNLRKALIPIRAELSILAAILCLGHIVKYGGSYLAQLVSTTAVMPTIRYWMLGIAILLLLLLIPLAVSSTQFVHSRMNQKSWQRLQLLAYPFYGLIIIHSILCLLVPALAGSLSAVISASLYLALGVSYATLRIRRYLLTKKNSAAAVRFGYGADGLESQANQQ